MKQLLFSLLMLAGGLHSNHVLASGGNFHMILTYDASNIITLGEFVFTYTQDAGKYDLDLAVHGNGLLANRVNEKSAAVGKVTANGMLYSKGYHDKKYKIKFLHGKPREWFADDIRYHASRYKKISFSSRTLDPLSAIFQLMRIQTNQKNCTGTQIHYFNGKERYHFAFREEIIPSRAQIKKAANDFPDSVLFACKLEYKKYGENGKKKEKKILFLLTPHAPHPVIYRMRANRNNILLQLTKITFSRR